jgi:hypothetical protein
MSNADNVKAVADHHTPFGWGASPETGKGQAACGNVTNRKKSNGMTRFVL